MVFSERAYYGKISPNWLVGCAVQVPAWCNQGVSSHFRIGAKDVKRDWTWKGVRDFAYYRLKERGSDVIGHPVHQALPDRCEFQEGPPNNGWQISKQRGDARNGF